MSEILTITEHQELKVSRNRDLSKNIISTEDKNLLLEIQLFNSKNNKYINVFKIIQRGKIKACSIVGSISLKNNVIVEILPKIA